MRTYFLFVMIKRCKHFWRIDPVIGSIHHDILYEDLSDENKFI